MTHCISNRSSLRYMKHSISCSSYLNLINGSNGVNHTINDLVGYHAKDHLGRMCVLFQSRRNSHCRNQTQSHKQDHVHNQNRNQDQIQDHCSIKPRRQKFLSNGTMEISMMNNASMKNSRIMSANVMISKLHSKSSIHTSLNSSLNSNLNPNLNQAPMTEKKSRLNSSLYINSFECKNASVNASAHVHLNANIYVPFQMQLNSSNRRHYSFFNKQRKNPYDASPLSFPVRIVLKLRRIFSRFSMSLYMQMVNTSPSYKRQLIRFIPFVGFIFLILAFALVYPGQNLSFDGNPARGKNMGWNGEVDDYWKHCFSRYMKSAGNFIFAVVLGGNNEADLVDTVSYIYGSQKQVDLNVDFIMKMISEFLVPRKQEFHVDGHREVVNYTKEQNQRYEKYLEKIFMNLNHSFPLFVLSVFISDPKEVYSMCRFLRNRLVNELLPGEEIIMPLYTEANVNESIRGPHRSYMCFKLHEEDGKRFVDLSFYDTKTIHWALNPLGMTHHDRKGYVRVDYKSIPLDDAFQKKLYSFLLQVERFPNGSYRTSNKYSPIRNFADYRTLALNTFGRVEIIPQEKHKLQKYETGSWEALEKIFQDWSDGDIEVYQRFKYDFRKYCINTILMMKIPSHSNLVASLCERQVKKDEAKLYNTLMKNAVKEQN